MAFLFACVEARARKILSANNNPKLLFNVKRTVSMDLHSGLPLWIATNKLYNYYRPLAHNAAVEVAIIGSGITGSLIAHELCSHGVHCCVVDKRSIALGSTSASTSQLQYEIDTPLHRLIETIGEQKAVAAYKDSLQAITDIHDVLKSTESEQSFRFVPTFYCASNKQSVAGLKRELEARKKYGLPVEFFDDKELSRTLGVGKPAALYNETSAQMDSYQAATGILKYHQKKNKLQLYSHTLVENYRRNGEGYILTTSQGYRIRCRYVVIAAGFEAGQFLPKNVMKLISTYAIASQPIAKDDLWYKRALIWETNQPYLYMRTTADNRIIVGGEDIPYSSPQVRDKLLRQKVNKLEKKFTKFFPQIPFVREMSWCGTFSATADGLPFIGAWPRRPRMLFALGYGGNGITFSMLAAKIISNIVQERKDLRIKRYGFNR